MIRNRQSLIPFGIEYMKKGDIQGYASAYMKSINKLNDHIGKLDGVKTAITVNMLEGVNDLIRASVVLSDLTTLTLARGRSATVVLSLEDDRTVTLPTMYLNKCNINPDDIRCHIGVWQCHEGAYISFYKEVLPLLEKGWLVIRPPRVAFIKTGDRSWQVFDVEPNSQDDNWIVSGESQDFGEIPLRIINIGDIPLDLVIPYIRNIPYGEFTKILEDSSDTLINLRRGLRDAISNISMLDQKDVAEMRRDIIEPNIENLERHYKKALAAHKSTITGASIGLIGLSLSAILTGGPTAVISGLLGTGGISYLGKEYSEFRRKLEEMKDDPFYLFWRAKYKH